MNFEAEERTYEKGALAKIWGLFLYPHFLLISNMKLQSQNGSRGEGEMGEVFWLIGAKITRKLYSALVL